MDNELRAKDNMLLGMDNFGLGANIGNTNVHFKQ